MSIPREKLEGVKKALEFFDFFTGDECADVCHWVDETDENTGAVQKVPTYKNRLIDFVETVYNAGILEPDYVNIMNSLSGGETELEVIIYSLRGADYRMCAAVLTCLIRQEIFSPGLWERATAEGWFAAILQRLSELARY